MPNARTQEREEEGENVGKVVMSDIGNARHERERDEGTLYLCD